MEIQFGYFPTPYADDYPAIVRTVRLAETLGLDLVGIQDHPYHRKHMDTWTLLAALAAQTERIRLFPDVASLPLRPPATLAKAAASLDLISDGRFELGLGAGAMWDPIEAIGGPRRSPAEAVAALSEAIDVIRLLWSDQPSASFEGAHYRLRGAKPGPRPAHDIGIWLGAYKPRMLRLIGRKADGWLPSSSYVDPTRLHEQNSLISEAATEAGRDPAGIRRLYNIFGRITDGESHDRHDGPVQQWVDELTELTNEQGMT
ncbi:MAG: LLM class flavin-dependent oxidoreductase, partial [Micromonosporaceae bacterium]|nr:LLM class flavin-dependent oxidoreductase [Micromonosporaceae bacterium]